MANSLIIATEICASELPQFKIHILIYRKGIEYGESPVKYNIGNDGGIRGNYILNICLSPKNSTINNLMTGKIHHLNFEFKDFNKSDDELVVSAIDKYLCYFKS